MPQITTTITHGVGLHARPAAMFVKTAKQFTSTISVHTGVRTANAKSMVQVLTLAAKQGSELRIEAVGDDAEQALQALKELIEANFHEEAP
ncbi:MAG: HPr family phosphocarrier protein [Herpetosiphon sp.]